MSMQGPKVALFNETHSKFFPLFDYLRLQEVIIDQLLVDPVPFDRYCFPLQADIQRRICPTCGFYFSFIVSMNRHKVLHSVNRFKQSQTMIVEQDHEEDHEKIELNSRQIKIKQDELAMDGHTSAPVIVNIFDCLQSDFVQIIGKPDSIYFSIIFNNFVSMEQSFLLVFM